MRPGTDTALAMAWIYVMAEEDLVDHDFIDKWCYGYDELVQRVQEMPPSRAAVICGVPEEQIWRAARLYGKAKPSSLAWGLAVDENPNGTQLGQCLIALMSITGFIDAPGGTTLGMGDDQGNVVRDGGAIDSSEKVDDETDSTLMLALKHGIMTQETWDTKRIGIDKYPAVGSVMWTAHPDEFLKALETEEPFKIHMAQFVSSNPVGTAIAAEPQRWYKALKKLDFNFACDLFMNPTIMACCDVFLPVASTIEHDGMVVTHYGLNSSFYGAQNKCVQVGECKSDVEIMMMVGKKTYPEFWARFETQKDYDDFHVMRSWLPFDTLREEVVHMSNEPYYKYAIGKLRPDGRPGFPTSTGRHRTVLLHVRQLGRRPVAVLRAGGLRSREPARNGEGIPLHDDYGRAQAGVLPFRAQAGSKPAPARAPWPELDMNPADAEALGVNEGDWVEIESPYGKIRQRAKITPTIKQGRLPRHAWMVVSRRGRQRAQPLRQLEVERQHADAQ